MNLRWGLITDMHKAYSVTHNVLFMHKVVLSLARAKSKSLELANLMTPKLANKAFLVKSTQIMPLEHHKEPYMDLQTRYVQHKQMPRVWDLAIFVPMTTTTTDKPIALEQQYTFTLLKIGPIEMISNLAATFKGRHSIHINQKLFTFHSIICIHKSLTSNQSQPV